MSRRVITRTPIIDKECLIEALKASNCQYQDQGNRISVQIGCGITYIQKDTHFSVDYYSDHRDEKNFVESVNKAYLRIYKAKLERLERERLEAEAIKERERLEEEARREREKLEAFKEAQKAQIIEKAKKQGYKVKEVKKGDKIQLVCVRYA